MEFSFPLNTIEKYLRQLQKALVTDELEYEGIVLFLDQSSHQKTTVGLCLYKLNSVSNLDLLLPRIENAVELNPKKTSKLFCKTELPAGPRPGWDIVFFSKSDWERALRLAKKQEGEKCIVFKNAACFPMLGLSSDGISGFSNLIMLANKQSINSHSNSPNFDFSFGKPYPPIWKDEALSIAFRLIEHKLVNNQWLINLISKIDRLQKETQMVSTLTTSNQQQSAAPAIAPKRNIKRKSGPRKTSSRDQKITLDTVVKPVPKSSIKLNTKQGLDKKKTTKKKSKKQFKINNLGFSL